MAAAYLDPNLNHTPNSSTKTHLGTGVERSPGAMERVLKVFHYFESNSEPTTWASIIRHGDATDVRGIIQKIVDSHKVKHVACYGFRLSHLRSEEVHWLHLDMGVSNVREKYELAHPPEEWNGAWILKSKEDLADPLQMKGDEDAAANTDEDGDLDVLSPSSGC
uniref:Protein tyrosine kinase 2 n=1 Tax=Phocoena sinus TaxID=42100 RepID=A0A8C9CE47_PHOSS